MVKDGKQIMGYTKQWFRGKNYSWNASKRRRRFFSYWISLGGASREKLEEELKAKIEEAKREQKTVYGVELQGNSNGAINVDHHKL